MAKRKRRDGEVVCRCSAYRFPHRQFGGNCQSDILATTWENHLYDKCRGCRMYQLLPADDQGFEQPFCAALEGIETFHEAECIQEHVAANEIKLYGVNKPPEKRKRR